MILSVISHDRKHKKVVTRSAIMEARNQMKTAMR
jgi:hypothetical protein